MLRRYTLIILMVALCSGCLISLNPYYSQKDLIELPEIEGQWIRFDHTETNTRYEWHFERTKENEYRGIMQGMDLSVHFFRLDTFLFMDMEPISDRGSHIIAKLEMGDDILKMSLYNGDFLADLKREGKLNIEHEGSGDEFRLTASTKKLQELILHYANQEGFFIPMIMFRKGGERHETGSIWEEANTALYEMQIKKAKKNEVANLQAEWFQAVDSNNHDQLDSMVKEGYDVNVLNRARLSALHLACDSNNIPLVKHLLLLGANPNNQGKYSSTPLFHVKSEEVAQLLISAGANAKHRNKFNWTALIKQQDTSVLKVLFINGADINHFKDKFSLLSMAVRKGNTDLITFLIKNGVEINQSLSCGSYPLCYAPNRSIVELLINHGAEIKEDMNLQFIRDAEALEYLLANGAKADQYMDFDCRQQGHLICESPMKYERLKVYLEHGVDPNSLDAKGDRTALSWAVSRGEIPTIELLLSYGADLNMINKRGVTLLELSRNKGMWEWLKSHGARSAFELLYDLEEFADTDLGYVEAPALIPYRNGAKWGYSNRNKEIIIETIYEEVWPFSESVARVMNNGKYGLIDEQGHTVFPVIYDQIGDFKEGLACVELSDKFGLIDKGGNIIAPIIYDHSMNFSDDDTVWNFHDGLVKIAKNGKCGFIDRSGKLVVEAEYQCRGLSYFEDNMAQFQNATTGKYGYLDTSGQIAIEAVFESGDFFHSGLATMMLDSNLIYIDKQGEEVIRLKGNLLFIDDFYDEVARVYQNGKWVYINRKGKVVVRLKRKYDFVGQFYNGRAVVKYDNKFGLIDKEGKEIVSIRYDYVEPISEKRFKFYQGGRIGLFDEKGNQLTPIMYNSMADEFSEGLLMVDTAGRYGFIDMQGEQVIPLIYSETSDTFKNGLASVVYNGKMGVINKEGKLVVPLRYRNCDLSYVGLIKVKPLGRGERDFFISLLGEVYFED
ncbi:MAG: WG repeat-containing protein [Bacteroidetes bacterium]|nr:WG repeat-containing protein [Bacteroidota bacterium]